MLITSIGYCIQTDLIHMKSMKLWYEKMTIPTSYKVHISAYSQTDRF